MKIEDEVIHRRTIRAVIDWDELQRLAVDAVLRRAGYSDADLPRMRSSFEAEVRADDATAGSPPYRVGTKLIVRLGTNVGDTVAAAEDSP